MHQHFHWVVLKRDIGTYVSTCDACQRVKARLPEHPHPDEGGAVDHIHIDLFGPYHRNLSSKTTDNNPKVYLVVMMDPFTKMADFYPVVGKSSLSMARAFYHALICRYGVPQTVTSDYGKNLESTSITCFSVCGLSMCL